MVIRGGSSDIDTFADVFGELPHLPPSEIVPSLVWDLGANVGLTMAHMAHVWPDARIVGVELDSGNAALARRNVARYGPRCTVICGAVWTERTTVGIRRTRGHESGFRVALGGREAATVTLNDLHAQTGRPDFVKMDIEGAERHVLTERVEWAATVPVILVECHGSYTADVCASELRALGYTAEQVEHRHGRPAVLGRRCH